MTQAEYVATFSDGFQLYVTGDGLKEVRRKAAALAVVYQTTLERVRFVRRVTR